jgi:formate transporter
VLRNWAVVCAANFAGAAGLALLVWWSGHPSLNGGAVGRAVTDLALAKAALPPGEAFFRGVLCNVLVCLAVWMALAGRSVVDKAVAVVFPVTAFVARRLRAFNRQHVPLPACDAARRTARRR